MHVFRTEIIVPLFEKKINYSSSILLIGSCFSENIQQKFSYYKFSSLSNPFGIIYNPISIAKSIERIVENKFYTEDELLLVNENWISLDHHGLFSGTDKNIVLQNINQSIENWHQAIKKASHIFITLGSAWVYKHKAKDSIVGNCHKLPSTAFEKQLLSTHDIINALQNAILYLKKINHQIQVIFTISPVRHLRDGFTENQTSKSILFVALHELMQKEKSASYFPAYEILMDDLRDYRFYADDMVHPNNQAIAYIWEKLKNTFIQEDCFYLMDEIEKIKKAIAHKPFNTSSDQHQAFLKNQLFNIQKIENNFSRDFFKKEKELLQIQLNS